MSESDAYRRLKTVLVLKVLKTDKQQFVRNPTLSDKMLKSRKSRIASALFKKRSLDAVKDIITMVGRLNTRTSDFADILNKD